MENASKALFMAAGVLVGILILSLAVYLFTTFGATSAKIHKQNEENQLNQFNAQFTSYEGKGDNTIYDVITVANLATENNRKYEFTTRIGMPNNVSNDNYIYVKLETDYELLDGAGITGDSISFGNDKDGKTITNIYNQVISNALKKSDELKYYDCNVVINPYNRRVCKVIFRPANSW